MIDRSSATPPPAQMQADSGRLWWRANDNMSDGHQRLGQMIKPPRLPFWLGDDSAVVFGLSLQKTTSTLDAGSVALGYIYFIYFFIYYDIVHEVWGNIKRNT